MIQIFRSTRAVLPGGVAPADVVVDGEGIAAVVAHGAASGGAVRDLGDLALLAGVVDSHVHINEPGRTEWEGFASATQAAAAGGITTVIDMPLNCIPATVSRAAAEAKAEAQNKKLHVDAAFWGGVIPGNHGQLAGLAEFGCAGAKCFTCPSGVDEFPAVDAADLDLALPLLRDLGMTLLVHAEAPGPLDAAARATAGADPRCHSTWLAQRPDAAEVEAVAMIIDLLRRHGGRAHIVHLASADAVPLLAQAQADGVAITAETCLHYLTFCAEEIFDGATLFKCAPPIRSANNRDRLWRGLADGVVSMVVSDHSPCVPALKCADSGDFAAAWGGIAGLQLGLPALWTAASARGFDLAQVSRWNAQHTARLAGLADRKGAIAAGCDADFAVFDPDAVQVIEGGRLHHRHKATPWHGRALRGRVEQTWLRGRLAWSRSAGFAAPAGRLIRPTATKRDAGR